MRLASHYEAGNDNEVSGGKGFYREGITVMALTE
jgi:hypothetical protein